MRELVRDAAERAEAAAGGVEQRERVHVRLARREVEPRRASAGRCWSAPRWCRSAPLGKPVVPDVYWIWTGSSGATSGSASVGAPDARNAVEVGEGDRLAELGKLAAHAPRATAPSGCRGTRAAGRPRPRRTARGRTSSSPGLYAGLTVTRIRPASAAPNSSTSHSGMLGAHTATRSPGAKRPSSARAQRSASSQQLAVGPAPALRRIGVPADQRGLVGHRLGRVAQDPPDRRVENRRRSGPRGSTTRSALWS